MKNNLTKIEKIERMNETTLNQVKEMVAAGRSSEDIARFQKNMLEIITLISQEEE